MQWSGMCYMTAFTSTGSQLKPESQLAAEHMALYWPLAALRQVTKSAFLSVVCCSLLWVKFTKNHDDNKVTGSVKRSPCLTAA